MKVFVLCGRCPDLSPEDAHDYWRHPHGTWGARMSTLHGYVQSHKIHTDLLGPRQVEYDFVAEMWLHNLEDLRALGEEPVFKKYLIPDGPNFLDMSRSIIIATDEEVLTSGPWQNPELNPGDEFWSDAARPISVKLLHFVARASDQSSADQSWTSRKDVSLGRSLGALRYVRCTPLMAFHGDEAPFLGVQELWWPTVRAFREGVGVHGPALDELLKGSPESMTLLVQAERLR